MSAQTLDALLLSVTGGVNKVAIIIYIILSSINAYSVIYGYG